MQIVWLPARAIAAIIHFSRELPRARLLLAGIGLGLTASIFATLVLGDALALARSVTNYVLLTFYALVIHLATDRPAEAPRSPLPRLQLALWFVFAAWIAAHTLGVRFPWIEAGINEWILEPLHTWTGLGAARVDALGSAAWRILYTLFLPWLAFSLLGQRPRDLGLRPRKLALGLLLVGVGVGLHLLARSVVPNPPDPFSLASKLTSFLGAWIAIALPLEFFYRGLLLPRLEARFRSPLDALALSALLYSLAQVPAGLTAHTPAPTLALDVLGGLGNAPALAWGYLYLRTRSVWPGAIWHASHLTLGGAFW